MRQYLRFLQVFRQRLRHDAHGAGEVVQVQPLVGAMGVGLQQGAGPRAVEHRGDARGGIMACVRLERDAPDGHR